MKERDSAAIREPGATHAISDTGPLISVFQSDSLELVTTVEQVYLEAKGEG